MASVTLLDVANRTTPVAEKRKRWTPKKDFHPGGEKGKLHREIGVPEGEKIPAEKLAKATHSSNPETRRDAIRARTMKDWSKSKSPIYSGRGKKD